MPAGGYLEPKLLDLILGAVAFTAPATVYVGLSTAAATTSDATVLAAEPSSTGSYARVSVTNNATNWPAASGTNPASKSNGTAITFPTSTAAWSSGATALQTFFVADASTLGGGNILLKGALTANQTVNASNIAASFAIGQLSATCT
jgi:hypothetical protein